MANLTASGATPQVLFEDSTGGHNDFALEANASVLSVDEDDSGWSTHFTWSSTASTAKVDAQVRSEAPVVELVDTTSTPSVAYDFRLVGGLGHVQDAG